MRFVAMITLHTRFQSEGTNILVGNGEEYDHRPVFVP